MTAAFKRGKRAASKRAPLTAHILYWWPIIAVFAAALLLRWFIPANSDTSWDLTLAEKVLAGAKLYVDVIEINPPATIYLYLPFVWLGHLISLRPEWLLNGFIFTGAAISLWYVGRILSSCGALPRIDRRALLACGLFVLTIMPSRAFAEREHIEMIFALPAFAVFIAFASRRSASFAAEIIGGLGAGLMVILKPYLVLGIIFAAIAAAISARSWRPIFAMQNWIAALLCVLYVLWVWTAFPAFFSDIMPLAATVYLPLKGPPMRLLFKTGLVLWMASFPLIFWFAGKKIATPLYLVPLAASCGFALAYVLQGKAWPYQSYPALTLSTLALSTALLDRFYTPHARSAAASRIAAACLVAAIGVLGFFWMIFAVDVSGLVAPLRAMKPHSKIMALSDDLGLGFPLTREVGGEWVGRMPSLWVTAHVRILRRGTKDDPIRDAKLAAYAERDRKIFGEDVIRAKPDLILLDWRDGKNWLAWAKADPALSEILKAYRVGPTIDGVTILSRGKAF